MAADRVPEHHIFPGVDSPSVRATAPDGGVWDEPSEDLLLELLNDCQYDGDFVIVEKDATHFAQTAWSSQQPWVVEYRKRLRRRALPSPYRSQARGPQSAPRLRVRPPRLEGARRLDEGRVRATAGVERDPRRPLGLRRSKRPLTRGPYHGLPLPISAPDRRFRARLSVSCGWFLGRMLGHAGRRPRGPSLTWATWEVVLPGDPPWRIASFAWFG